MPGAINGWGKQLRKHAMPTCIYSEDRWEERHFLTYELLKTHHLAGKEQHGALQGDILSSSYFTFRTRSSHKLRHFKTIVVVRIIASSTVPSTLTRTTSRQRTSSFPSRIHTVLERV